MSWCCTNQVTALGVFSLAKLFTFPAIIIPSENSPVYSFSCLKLPPALADPLIFKLPCLCCFLYIHLLSFVPPACLKAFCSLFMVPLWRRPHHREKKKRTWDGKIHVVLVFVACEEHTVLVLGSVWMRDWFIVLFSCCPGAKAVADLTETVKIYAQVCVYYRLFQYVHGDVSAMIAQTV